MSPLQIKTEQGFPKNKGEQSLLNFSHTASPNNDCYCCSEHVASQCRSKLNKSGFSTACQALSSWLRFALYKSFIMSFVVGHGCLLTISVFTHNIFNELKETPNKDARWISSIQNGQICPFPGFICQSEDARAISRNLEPTPCFCLPFYLCQLF